MEHNVPNRMVNGKGCTEYNNNSNNEVKFHFDWYTVEFKHTQRIEFTVKKKSHDRRETIEGKRHRKKQSYNEKRRSEKKTAHRHK